MDTLIHHSCVLVDIGRSLLKRDRRELPPTIGMRAYFLKFQFSPQWTSFSSFLLLMKDDSIPAAYFTAAPLLKARPVKRSQPLCNSAASPTSDGLALGRYLG
jgi:hypothetical protein